MWIIKIEISLVKLGRACWTKLDGILYVPPLKHWSSNKLGESKFRHAKLHGRPWGAVQSAAWASSPELLQL